MATVLTTAEDFAFGPVGKLLSVTSELAGRGHDIVFVGTGTALELASRSSFHRCVPAGADDARAVLERELDAAELLVSCMDRVSLELAQNAGVPAVWLDSLFWWWDDIPEHVLRADVYIAQRSVNDARNAVRFRDRIRNYVEVGPIVDRSAMARTDAASQLIINFGGMEAAGWYRIGEESDYPFTVMRLIDRHVGLGRFERVLVTGNERIMHRLDAEYRAPFEFRTLAHSEFLVELTRAEVLLTVPGLETPLESWTYGVPTVFLPPSNSSQYVQLDEYRRSGVAAGSVHFRDVMAPMELADLPLRLAMSRFLHQLREFEHDVALQRWVGARIDDLVADRGRWASLVTAGHRYVEGLGGDGVASAVKAIEGVLADGRLPR